MFISSYSHSLLFYQVDYSISYVLLCVRVSIKYSSYVFVYWRVQTIQVRVRVDLKPLGEQLPDKTVNFVLIYLQIVRTNEADVQVVQQNMSKLKSSRSFSRSVWNIWTRLQFRAVLSTSVRVDCMETRHKSKLRAFPSPANHTSTW